MLDDDVSGNRASIRSFLDVKEPYLSFRALTDNQKREAYERQKVICWYFELSGMEADHITLWHLGGRQTRPIARCLAKTITEKIGDVVKVPSR